MNKRNVEASTNYKLLTIFINFFISQAGVGTKSIGVICPFTSQVEFVRSMCPDIETNTVDQYQGRDKEVIIYSCTRSMPRKSYEAHVRYIGR